MKIQINRDADAESEEQTLDNWMFMENASIFFLSFAFNNISLNHAFSSRRNIGGDE